MSDENSNWLLVNHLDCDGDAVLTSIQQAGASDEFIVNNLTSNEPSGKTHAPWFLGLHDGQVILFDPEHKTVSLEAKMPTDAFPAYSYTDPNTNRIWFMNDGDKETGNDPLNCGDQGSTVTIFEKGTSDNPPKHIKTLCVGRGHHVTTFIAPSGKFPDLPNVAYVSNLLDGSICVVDNDENSANFLTILHTINLLQADKEKDSSTTIPNNAFPHGKQFSEETGKIYSLNNGYGNVDVINPANNEIESRITLKGCSNLLLTKDGKYMVGKGADRKSDPDHVIGRLAVVDATAQKVLKEYSIPDFYPSVYRFSPDGQKLYVTSAATGKGNQKENLNIDSVYVYDASKLPELNLLKIENCGQADCGRRPIAFPTSNNNKLTFIPNPTDGSLSILDSTDDSVISTIKIADKGGKEFNFSLYESSIYGA